MLVDNESTGIENIKSAFDFETDMTFNGIINNNLHYVSHCTMNVNDLLSYIKLLKVDVVLTLNIDLDQTIQTIGDSNCLNANGHLCLVYKNIDLSQLKKLYNIILHINQFHSIKGRLNI